VFVLTAPDGLSDARTLIVYPQQPPSSDGVPTAPWTVGLTFSPPLRQRISIVGPSERFLILAPPLTDPAPLVIAYLVLHIPASAEEGSIARASVRYAVLASPSPDGLEPLIEWAQGGPWPDVMLPQVLSRGEASAVSAVSHARADVRGPAYTASIGDYLVKPGAILHVPVRLGQGIRRAATYAFVRVTAVPTVPSSEPLRVVDVAKPLLPASASSVTTDAPTDPIRGAVSATIELASAMMLWPADPLATVALQAPSQPSDAAYHLRLSACFAAEDGTIIDPETRDGAVFLDARGRLTATTYIQYGDVDADGEITTADSAAAVRHVLGLSALSPDQVLAADVWPSAPSSVGDGRLSLEDVREILRRALGI